MHYSHIQVKWEWRCSNKTTIKIFAVAILEPMMIFYLIHLYVCLLILFRYLYPDDGISQNRWQHLKCWNKESTCLPLIGNPVVDDPMWRKIVKESNKKVETFLLDYRVLYYTCMADCVGFNCNARLTNWSIIVTLLIT